MGEAIDNLIFSLASYWRADLLQTPSACDRTHRYRTLVISQVSPALEPILTGPLAHRGPFIDLRMGRLEHLRRCLMGDQSSLILPTFFADLLKLLLGEPYRGCPFSLLPPCDFRLVRALTSNSGPPVCLTGLQRTSGMSSEGTFPLASGVQEA
jgi:hypothetical protein